MVKGKLYSFDADVYLHHFSSDLVGYKSKKGAYKVIEKDDLLGVVTAEHPQKGLMSVDLFQDVGGEYFPALTDSDKYYSIRLMERWKRLLLMPTQAPAESLRMCEAGSRKKNHRVSSNEGFQESQGI